MGDFNDVRDVSERMNSEFVVANAEAFNQFILSAGLVEYNMGGGNFMYISDNGKKLSKLDRFLVCLGFRERWPNAMVLALAREASDHRPIVLSTVQSDFGQIPFGFFNSWFEYSGFLEHVLQKCGEFNFLGPADLAVAIKLRYLKNNIKSWLKVEKENREGIYGGKKKRLELIENIAEERLLLEEECGGKLISEQQSAFLTGRNIMDGPLVLNEVLSWLRKNKREGMFFKVDINKAYDSVNWSFLDSVMAQMRFPSKWRSWVMATLYSARASVLVNGSPTREFDCSRGLRQGDP
ncbi:uncharacterized protein LOC118480187 [Helianthus annuus]|uniref:uncharacterized protein LOC118480187 n=1 Tax=Helianthus annuus TaxID=4232 RepID=UPI001652F569|nr:uncharacterized protein LOC118480187 [Helianthus annuus]